MQTTDEIFKAIQADPQNKSFTDQKIQPLYHIDPKAEILIISQAPSRKAQQSMVFWNDPSGDRLRSWMGLSKADFYYPGRGAHGDLPPRKGFAEKWHEPLLKLMPNLRLKLLIGQYAQKAYLQRQCKRTLTETVKAYQEYLPEYFPLVHPSPLNYGWMHKNTWFEAEVVPALQREIEAIMAD